MLSKYPTATKIGKRKWKPTPLYGVWEGMRRRCLNASCEAYKDYGGRGISICREWKDDFQAFSAWAVSNGYRKGLQIDRTDNNGGYDPNNCRFVTNRINRQNSRAFRNGATWNKKHKKFYSNIKFEKHKLYLGCFNTRAEAESTYFYASAIAELGIKPVRFLQS